MERIVVDTFIVPEESRSAFLELASRAQGFLKTLPGFVEGYLYERVDLTGTTNFMTTAVWENEEAYENAKKSATSEFQKWGFNQPEALKKLKIEKDRALYTRSPW